MSRSTQGNVSKVKSPIKYYLEYRAGHGHFSYWDGKENKTLDSLSFVMLDVKYCITGFSDSHNSRVYSNTISSTREELTVKAKNEVVAKGLYADIKDALSKVGGNYTTSIYALALIDNVWEPVCIQFSKTGLQGWSDFTKDYKPWDLYKHTITCVKGEQKKKGKVVFYPPTFTTSETEESVDLDAKDFDANMLQPYFRGENVEVAETTQEEVAPF